MPPSTLRRSWGVAPTLALTGGCLAVAVSAFCYALTASSTVVVAVCNSAVPGLVIAAIWAQYCRPAQPAAASDAQAQVLADTQRSCTPSTTVFRPFTSACVPLHYGDI